jgi:hypothetical protein
MSFQMFHERCPEIGASETRSVTLSSDSGHDLPADAYAFLEMYCADAGCDCRRVYFQVIALSNPGVVLAVISWGWEPLAFYRRWGSYPEAAKDAKDMKGPALALLNKQSALAPALLELADTVLLSSPEYVERIKRHYILFRIKIDSQTKGQKRRALR